MDELRIEDRLIVALDFSTEGEAETLVDRLEGVISFFKVGSRLFTTVGPQIVEKLKNRKAKVFLDLKFHDIPSTVAGSCEAALNLGVDIFNVHTLGGLEMMREAAKTTIKFREKQKSKTPLLLGVTLLTSLSKADLKELLGLSERTFKEEVLHLARLAQRAGLDGVITSMEEIKPIRKNFGPEFVIMTPGIRPRGTLTQDQKRVMTPEEAVRAGADYLVIGRPIIQAADPVKAAKEVIEEMRRGFGAE